jgi:succinate-acetate transporter protein
MPIEDVKTDAHAQIYLQPIAAPSILGLYGLAGATFMVAAHMAHWFGNSTTSLYLFPFAAIFGGLAQFLAGMWAYKARDGVATAIHGMWGSFWMAYGVLNVIFAVGKATPPNAAWPEIGFWYVVLAAITWVGVAAAAAQNKGLVTLLTFLAAGSTTGAIGEFLGAEWLMILTGWLFIVASVAAWYTGSALMLEEAFGREVWGLGKSKQMKQMAPVSTGAGEPGVIRGQA